jgi:hypothetical protein
MTPPENAKTTESEEVRVVRSCNLHIDCDKANAESLARGRGYASHCHDDCCEDCFGS